VSKKPRETLCQWTDDEMLSAMDYAQRGIVSINEARRCYKIPPKTLKDIEISIWTNCLWDQDGCKALFNSERRKGASPVTDKLGYGKIRKERSCKHGIHYS